MNTDAVIGCDAVEPGAEWLRLRTAGGSVRTMPWSAVKLAGLGGNHEGRMTIQRVTEQVTPLFATHDSLWVVYAEGGFAQVMIEKVSPKRGAILATFAEKLGALWRGDELTQSELTSTLFQMPAQVKMPKLVVVMLAVIAVSFLLAIGVLFFVGGK